MTDLEKDLANQAAEEKAKEEAEKKDTAEKKKKATKAKAQKDGKDPSIKFLVSCPKLGGVPFKSKKTTEEAAAKDFRDSCKGLSEDAVLNVAKA